MTPESLRRTISKDYLWPNNNSEWDFHAGNPKSILITIVLIKFTLILTNIGVFRNLRFFDPPLTARYGSSDSLESYSRKAQLAVYESHRAMFEAYSRNKYEFELEIFLPIVIH